ncbi:hypothetical protein GAY28_01630 [Azospirillum brasilense]|nr:hypothetical protein [Azospirillum brasilense]
MLEGQWGRVTAAVMSRPEIDPSAKAVYAFLATKADRAGYVAPITHETIAQALGRSRTWVLGCIAKLEDTGVVQQHERFADHRRLPSSYQLLDRKTDVGVSRDNSIESGKRSLSNTDARRFDREETVSAPPEPTVVAEDWQPSAETIARAAVDHPTRDLTVAIRLFVRSCAANSYRYHDHDAAWLSWLDRQADWSKTVQHRRQKPSGQEPKAIRVFGEVSHSPENTRPTSLVKDFEKMLADKAARMREFAARSKAEQERAWSASK